MSCLHQEHDVCDVCLLKDKSKCAICQAIKFNTDNLQTFQWKGDGEEVIQHGSWSNWADPIKMNKIKKGLFEVKISLKEGNYQYKFVEDGIWKVSDKGLQTTDMKGNINNLILIKEEVDDDEDKDKYEKEESDITNDFFEEEDDKEDDVNDVIRVEYQNEVEEDAKESSEKNFPKEVV